MIFTVTIIVVIFLLVILRKISELKQDLENLSRASLKQNKSLKEDLILIKKELLGGASPKASNVGHVIEVDLRNEPKIVTEPKPLRATPIVPIEKEVKKDPDPILEDRAAFVKKMVPEKPLAKTINKIPTDKKEEVVKTAPKPKPKKTNTDLEKFIGENLLSKIGILIFVIGMGFLVKLGIDNGVVSEGMRVAIGVLCAGVLIGLAHYLRVSFTKFSSILIGGALAVLYFTIALAFRDYHILSQSAAFIIMVLITGFGVLLSIAYDKKDLAVLALIGGFGTPFFVSTGEGNVSVLFIYILILDIGMLALVYFKKWNVINYICFVFTYLLFAGAFFGKFIGHEKETGAMFFSYATLFYLIFFLMSIIYNVKNNAKFKFLEISSLLSNSAIYFGFGLMMTNCLKGGLYSGLFTALVATFNFVFAYVLFKRDNIDKNLLYLLIGLVLSFVSLIAPIQLKGNYITLFWAVEAVLLFWLSVKSEIKLMKLGAFVINLLMLVSLFMDWQQGYYASSSYDVALSIVFNKVFMTTAVVLLSLFATSYFLRKETEEFTYSDFKTSWIRNLAEVIFAFVFYVGVGIELYYQFNEAQFAYTLQVILFGVYNYSFVIGLNLVNMRRKSDSLAKLLAGLSLLVIGSYFSYYLYFIIEARDLSLTSLGSVNTGYGWHYVMLVLFIGILVMFYKKVYENTKFKLSSGNAALWLLSVIVVVTLTVEIGHLAMVNLWIKEGSITVIRMNIIKTVYPIVWGISALSLMIAGMKFKLKTLRIASLVLFLITVAKLFFWDLNGNTSGKIVSFIFLGVILLVVSFLYQKLKFIVQDDDKEEV